MEHPLKNKQRKPLRPAWLAVMLLAAALVLLALVLLWPRLFPTPVKQLYPDPVAVLPYETLHQNDTEQLSAITVEPLGGESYTLRHTGGTLLLETEEGLLDINDSLCASFLEATTTIAVENVVTRDATEVAEHLSDMGLEPPQITVRIAYTDGREELFHIGGNVPNTTYSYFRWSGDEGIYMCDAGIPELFSYTANQLLPFSQPTLISSLVDRLTIANEAGQLELSLRRDSLGNTAGQLHSPISYPINNDSAAALYTALENFRLGTLLGDAAALSGELGFDAPVCTVDIHQQEGMFTRINEEGQLVVENTPAQQLRFVFGRPEDEYFYTCAYEGKAYLVSRFLVEGLVAAAPEALLTAHPADLGGWPAQIALETPSGSLTVTVRQELRLQENGEPEENEDGEWIYDTIATLDGQPLPAQQAEALVKRLRALSFSGRLPEGWSPGEAAPRWKLTLTDADGNARTLAAYRLDAFSDAVTVDGVALHYCYVEALDAALGELKP